MLSNVYYLLSLFPGMLIRQSNMLGGWKQYMKKMIAHVIDVPDSVHLIGSKWVYIIKYKLDESIERYKDLLQEDSIKMWDELLGNIHTKC